MSGSENPVPGARPAASLTASLLARRGAARPAMRRQPMGNLAVLPITEDLGWNDMGEDAPPAAHGAPAPEPDEAPAVSPINQQIQALADRINARPTRETKRPATLTGAARKAAFTLRIDADRHLRLRLLSAVTNRSAQQLLIEALDALIARNDQLKDLAERAVDGNITADMKWGS
jgi:hypothetical protein